MKLVERCPTCQRKITRSTQANKRYWALLHALAGRRVRGKMHSADVWHLYCKSRFIGCTDIMLPDGTIITQPKSSRLEADKFSHYMRDVESLANSLGIYLEDREEFT